MPEPFFNPRPEYIQLAGCHGKEGDNLTETSFLSRYYHLVARMDLTSLLTACVSSTFTPNLQVFGTQILSIEALLVNNFSASVPSAFRFTQPSISYQNATFCNVTVTYTHPGQRDNVHAEAWLPVGNWNKRLLAVGGAGWVAGGSPISYETMKGALGDGYATITNDAGVPGEIHKDLDWALISPGNVNLYKLNNFGSVSINEQSIIGKSLIRSFYREGPSFSYWSGCSTGGRQGLMAAQRYPKAFDGISVGAPALYIPELLAGVQWSQQVMNVLGQYPHPCELDALTAAAISACDDLDGITDGIITNATACLSTFNPFHLVGTTIKNCTTTGTPLQISLSAAIVANSTWHGPFTPSGHQIHPGLSPSADLTGNDPTSGGQEGQAATNCTANGACTGVTNTIAAPWLRLFIAKDPNFNINNLSHSEFFRLIHAGRQQYSSLLSTDDADLTEFRDAGGKIISFHGLADQAIPAAGTEKYYRGVRDVMGGDEVRGFFRHYEVPGLGHCFGGRSGSPTGLFELLKKWVEEGTVPENSPIEVTGVDGRVQRRVICPWPQSGGLRKGCSDLTVEGCWGCVGPDA